MNDPVDKKILSLYVVFGALIMFGYGLMVKKYTQSGSYEIWSNQDKNIIMKNTPVRYAYYVMIVLSFVAGIYLVWYLTTTSKNRTDEILIYTGSVVFLVFSTVWAFRPLYYSKLVLGMVAVSTVLILAGICVNSESETDPLKIGALVASSIVVLQTGLFDFGIWNGFVRF